MMPMAKMHLVKREDGIGAAVRDDDERSFQRLFD